jgi:hypothetical protein
MIALVTGAAAAAGIRRVLAMGRRFPESGYGLVVGMDPAVPAILEELMKVGLVRGGRVVLGVGEDPVVASGDHLLTAEPVRSRSAAG